MEEEGCSVVEDETDELYLGDQLVSVAGLHQLVDVGDGEADQQVHDDDAEHQDKHDHEKHRSA